ncbi:hypothetical protein [Streptomyces sp. NPDC003635]
MVDHPDEPDPALRLGLHRMPPPGPARRTGDRGRYGRPSRERVLAGALEPVDRESLYAPSTPLLGAEFRAQPRTSSWKSKA